MKRYFVYLASTQFSAMIETDIVTGKLFRVSPVTRNSTNGASYDAFVADANLQGGVILTEAQLVTELTTLLSGSHVFVTDQTKFNLFQLA